MISPHVMIPLHDFNSGGTEVIAFRLAEQWLAAGWRVTVLAGASDGAMRDRVPAGVAVEVLDPPVRRSALSRLKLGRAMVPAYQRIAPDLVFIPGNFHFILAHAFKRARPDIPIVAKISNPLFPAGKARIPATGFGKPLLRRYLAPVDQVVAMTAGQARDFNAVVPTQRIPVIADPNVPDALVVKTMRDRRQASDPIQIALVGRLEPQKDVALSLDVLAALLPISDARLTVLGEGSLRGELEAQARRLGLGEKLTMPGFSDNVDAVLSSSDLLLITSRYEGLPGAAIEALAAGLPVVSTDCSEGLAVLLSDVRLGRIVTGRDPRAIALAICAQMAEPPAPGELLKATLAPSRYSISAETYLALFEELLATKSA